jgi:hypothetical protein
MKTLAATLLLVLASILVSVWPASAGGYTLENRPLVVFPGPHGGIAHQTPYPQGSRSKSVWVSDACWHDCNSTCVGKVDACIAALDPDQCRPHLDTCDRTCQRSCRSIWSGPLLGFMDF